MVYIYNRYQISEPMLDSTYGFNIIINVQKNNKIKEIIYQKEKKNHNLKPLLVLILIQL